MEINMTLQEWREKNDLSREELAGVFQGLGLAKVSREHIRRWEMAMTRPAPSQMVAVIGVTRGHVMPNSFYPPVSECIKRLARGDLKL
jgi:transcriptional regulator with XRE-family HTH domain